MSSTWRARFVALIAAVFIAGCLETRAPNSMDDAVSHVWKVPAALPKVDATQLLKGHADFVSKFPQRAGNSDTHKAARDALAKEFETAGLTVFRQNFTAGIDQQNVCGILWGEARDRWVVVGGHYDTVAKFAQQTGGEAERRSQGAYDDGSGTWITVALAKALASTKPYFTIIFCGFDGEERGTQGSGALFKAMTKDGFPYPVNETRAMLDLDMFGINWPVHASIYFTQNSPQIKAHIDAKRKAIGIPDPYFKFQKISGGSSDFKHWLGEFPTGFFISDFEEWMVPLPGGAPEAAPQVPVGKYPFWHQADTVETMTMMAGSPEALRAGFQNAVDLSLSFLELAAYHPETALTVETQ